MNRLSSTTTSCQPSTTSNTIAYRDTSTECGICLCRYEEDPTSDGDVSTKLSPAATVLELGCGHKWHLECIREQLTRAQQPHHHHRHSQRLVFHQCRCPKCGVLVDDHPALRDVLLRTDDSLVRSKVDRILAEHLQTNMSDISTSNSSNTQNIMALVEQLRHQYAFYLCSACHEPFLGGMVGKEEEQQQEENGKVHHHHERLCPACRTTVEKHESSQQSKASVVVWKCRYCCAPATRVCNDSSLVHMCEACHQRSIHLYQQQQAAGYHGLEAIPCPGGAKCPYPKPKENKFHSNGPYLSCEQVYCGSFDRTTNNNLVLDQQHHQQGRQSSCNLLINPSGKEQFKGWRKMNINDSWQVESSAVPLNQHVTTNFVSTHFWCTMEQTVDLSSSHAVATAHNPSQSRHIEVSAHFMGHADCPSVFRLQAEVLDAAGGVLQKLSTLILSAPKNVWERAVLVLEPTQPGARFVKMTLHGKDGLLMRGHYGSKVTNCSVRILGDDHLTQ